MRVLRQDAVHTAGPLGGMMKMPQVLVQNGAVHHGGAPQQQQSASGLAQPHQRVCFQQNTGSNAAAATSVHHYGNGMTHTSSLVAPPAISHFAMSPPFSRLPPASGMVSNAQQAQMMAGKYTASSVAIPGHPMSPQLGGNHIHAGSIVSGPAYHPSPGPPPSTHSSRHHRTRSRDRDERSVTNRSVYSHSQAVSGTETEQNDDRIEDMIVKKALIDGGKVIGIRKYLSLWECQDGTFGTEMEESIGFDCARYIGSVLTGILAFFAFISPIAMVILPRMELEGWLTLPCGPQCEGILISFAFKLLILLIGSWALFFRQPKATMPRVFIFRAVVLFLVFLLTFAFWLFYIVRIFQKREQNYYSILVFSSSLVDALLFIHYLAVIMLEIRHIPSQYCVSITRSPDGVTRSYNLGQLSIQRAATAILEQYYRDFPAYNPYLEMATSRRANAKLAAAGTNTNNYKFYDVDGIGGQGGVGVGAVPQMKTRAIFAAQARKRDSSHNDRFYMEEDYDRRLKKRSARLLTASEEAFSHIRRLQEEKGPAIPMDPSEAAQAVFPSLARSLQKYLRITRQQPRYSLDSILDHLSTCISHDMGPKAFVQKYLTQGPIVFNDKEYRPTQTWVLICDVFVSRALEDGMLFQLRQGEVSLLVTVRRLPHVNLTEEVIDPKHNRFVLRLNSETSV